MRKFFTILGGIFAVLIVVLAVAIFILVRKGSALDDESKTYVNDAVITITTHWDPDELMSRASPRFKEATKRDDLAGFFDAAKTALGPIVDYQGAKGSAFVMSTVGTGTTITANYVARAQFSKAEAQLQIALVKIDGQWRIEGFHVDSDVLMRALTGHST
jgi:hypothetical protein